MQASPDIREEPDDSRPAAPSAQDEAAGPPATTETSEPNDGRKVTILGWLRQKAIWICEIRESAHTIALGAAIGMFVGFLPIMGIQMYVALPIAFLLRGNKILAVAGVWLTNPLTFIPIYYFNYRVGLWIYRVAPVTWKRFSSLFRQFNWDKLASMGYDILVPLWVGSFVIAVIASIVSYGAVHWLVRHIRERRGIPHHP